MSSKGTKCLEFDTQSDNMDQSTEESIYSNSMFCPGLVNVLLLISHHTNKYYNLKREKCGGAGKRLNKLYCLSLWMHP